MNKSQRDLVLQRRFAALRSPPPATLEWPEIG